MNKSQKLLKSISESKSSTFEVAYGMFNKNDQIESKRKSFKTIEAAQKFIEKIQDHPNFYKIYATSSD